MKTNPHDPIHPTGFVDERQPPLTKREHFAALAMQGLLANAEVIKLFGDLSDAGILSPKHGIVGQALCGIAVFNADALIEALNEPIAAPYQSESGSVPLSVPVPDQSDPSREAAIRELAKDQWGLNNGVAFDDGAVVSEGEGNGAYVAAWVWADFEGTPLDKEKGKS